MSGYVPNNRNERTPPPKAPYNGDFNSQQTRPVEGSSVQPVNSLVGLRFIWDNGECLGANIPYNLTPAGTSVIRGSLDARGCLTQTIQGREYDAQLLADADVDNDVAKARSELQSALDEILSAERAEAAELQAIQDQRSGFMNGVHKSLAFGKGLFMAGVGMLDSAKQLNDLISPHTYLSNALRAAWNAKPAGGSRWVDSFLQNYSAEQHRELVEALGFDPNSITREQLADAYEVANFIYDDSPSKAMLSRFAVDYAKAQNVEEMAEFGGGAAFEIVLTAILAVFTAGVFVGIKAATSLRHLAKLKRLGNALTKLSAALKRARIKIKGKARGNGTGAQTVEVERPKGVEPQKLEAQKQQNSVENPPDDLAVLHARGNRPAPGERSLTKDEYKKLSSERRAQASIENVEGHGHARHGAHTTLNQQETRIQTGIAPDGEKAPTPRATKFDSNQAELEAVRRAEAVFEKNNAANPYPTTVTTPGGKVVPNTVPIVVGGKKGGYGSGLEVMRDASGKPLPGRPVQPTGQDQSAKIIFRYDQNSGKWIKITQYPTN